jgi:hypothetical protein
VELIIGGRLKDELLWVDDIAVVPSPEVERVVTGTVEQHGGQLIQTARIIAGLTLTATYTGGGDHIGVQSKSKTRPMWIALWKSSGDYPWSLEAMR